MEENVKVILASRVAPAIKEKVIQVAEDQGSTTSSYIESILLKSFEIGSGPTPDLSQNSFSADTIEQPDQTSPKEVDTVVTGSKPEGYPEVETYAQDVLPDPVIIEEKIQDTKEELLVNDENTLVEDLGPKEESLQEKEDGNLLVNVGFSQEANDELSLYLENLRTHYPDQSDDQLGLGALFAACCNETKWGQYIVKSYLSRSEEQRKSFIPSKFDN